MRLRGGLRGATEVERGGEVEKLHRTYTIEYLNFVYISLDIFPEILHNKLTELDAWLYFLGSDNPGDIIHITKNIPIPPALSGNHSLSLSPKGADHYVF